MTTPSRTEGPEAELAIASPASALRRARGFVSLMSHAASLNFFARLR